MKPVLSIVIPVYQVEAYVEKCIRSCYAQDVPLAAYEVIIVDDGGTDTSLEICKRLQKEFPALQIISQANKGLSGARNTGMANAIGDYIWFVDSDDWIEENCLKDIVKQIKESGPDLFWIGHDVMYQGNSKKKFVPEKTISPISGEDFFLDHLNNLFYIWKFIYRRDFLLENHLEFFEGILYEDLEFTPRALLQAKTCKTIPNIYYYYLLREGSIVNNINNKHVEDRIFILNKIYSIWKTDAHNPLISSLLYDIILTTFIGTINQAARSNVKLPETGQLFIKKLNNTKLSSKSFSINFLLMKISLNGYYNGYKLLHNIYKKLK